MAKQKSRGVKKVYNRWRAIAQVNGKRVHIGYYGTEEDAIKARKLFMKEIGRFDCIVDIRGEEWRESPLLGHPIWVSNKGRVKNIDFDRMGFPRLYKQRRSWRGRYCTIIVKGKTYMVHRLVADAFIGQSKLEVNHIDNNGINNCVENLEYVTHRENISHGFGGALGATFTDGYWQSSIKIGGKSKTLGYFNTKEEAHERYLQALRDIGEQNRYAKI
jgi:hypothetical protein